MADRDPPGPTGFLTLANALTVARLALLPLVIAGIARGQGRLAAAVMAVIVVTDLLDGRIARRLGQASSFGGTLDSTIDFVLIYSLFIAFYAAKRLSDIQFAILYLAMVSTFLLQIISLANPEAASVVRSRSGKVTGALQYLYLLLLVAKEALPGVQALIIADTLLFIPLAAAIVVSTVSAAFGIRRLLGAAGAAAGSEEQIGR